jgi:hypothetical protein
MSNTNNFEFLLVENIIKSLKNESELWETSIMGIKRITDNFELSIQLFDSIEIYKPYSYKFKDSTLMKKLYKNAKNLQQSKYKKFEDEKEKDNIKKISDFLNINTRKNKLIALNKLYKLYKLEEPNEIKIELKTNLFKKFLKKFF